MRRMMTETWRTEARCDESWTAVPKQHWIFLVQTFSSRLRGQQCQLCNSPLSGERTLAAECPAQILPYLIEAALQNVAIWELVLFVRLWSPVLSMQPAAAVLLCNWDPI